VDTINPDTATQVINALGEMNVERIVVTDGEGKVIYDSLYRRSTVGKFALLPEITQCLQGQDVASCSYSDGYLLGHAAVPIVRYDAAVGAVYIVDLDQEQGAVIRALEMNILRISVAVEVVLILFSVFFAIISFRKMRVILSSMEKAGQGEYSQKIRLKGLDEYSVMARGFNSLTDRLEESVQAQRQFVSDASHELKTPLASIKLLSDSILQNEMDGETTREFVADIGSEADRLTRIAQKLLELSKADSFRPDHEVVDLTQTVSRVYKMLVPVAAQRRIRLTFETLPSCTVLTAEDDMYQIFFNLVENAIKYNNENGQVHVRMIKEAEDVVVTVEDTGVGIPADAKPHVFERFYRVDKARSRQAGGSGLGLSIVRDLVVRNLGEIAVSDREQGGTCFTVRFPYFDVEVEP
jgi:signal transduction histidine kinase